MVKYEFHKDYLYSVKINLHNKNQEYTLLIVKTFLKISLLRWKEMLKLEQYIKLIKNLKFMLFWKLIMKSISVYLIYHHFMD